MEQQQQLDRMREWMRLLTKSDALEVEPGGGGGGGRYSSEFLVGVCCPVPQILTQFQTKISIFHTRFQTWPRPKIHTRFQTFVVS